MTAEVEAAVRWGIGQALWLGAFIGITFTVGLFWLCADRRDR